MKKLFALVALLGLLTLVSGCGCGHHHHAHHAHAKPACCK
jgi:hypothetical protein